MNCTEFELWLFEQIELRTVLDEIETPDHCAQCETCRKQWEEQLLLDKLIPHWRMKLPSVDLVTVVQSRLHDGPRPKEELSQSGLTSPINRTQGHALSLLAACASIVIVTMLVWTQRTPSVPETASTDQKNSTTVVESNPNSAPQDQIQPEVRMLIGEAGSAYAALGRDLKEAVKDASILLPSVPWSPDPSIEPKTPGGPNWVENVSQDIKPIGKKMTQAVGFLRKAVPSGLSERL